MSTRLHGRTAIVTGGGNGIGRATALRCAVEGANLVVTDLDLAAASAVVSEITDSGGTATALQADASSLDDAERTMSHAVEMFGQIDILINNAGLPSQYREGTDVHQWDLGIEVTLSSAYRQTRAALPHMIATGGGAILTVCSIAGNKVGSQVPWYDAAKAGLVGLTRHLAGVHGPAGVRANALCLGLIETQRTAFIHGDPTMRAAMLARTPLRRVGQPEEAAAAACFLVSDDASLVTGQMLVADGGSTIA